MDINTDGQMMDVDVADSGPVFDKDEYTLHQQYGALLRATDAQITDVTDGIADDAGKTAFMENIKLCKELLDDTHTTEYFKTFLKSSYAEERQAQHASGKIGPLAVPLITKTPKKESSDEDKAKAAAQKVKFKAIVLKRVYDVAGILDIKSPNNCQKHIMEATAKAYLTCTKSNIIAILNAADCFKLTKKQDARVIVANVYKSLDEAYTTVAAKSNFAARVSVPPKAGGRLAFARRAAQFQRSRIASILHSLYS